MSDYLTEERDALVRHLRESHPSLVGPSALNEGDLGGLTSMRLLQIVHDANHVPTWREHDADDWLTRDHRAASGGEQ